MLFSRFVCELCTTCPFTAGAVGYALHGQGHKVARPRVMHEVLPAAGLPQRL